MSSISRLYILDFGLFQVHDNNRLIGIPGYLLQTIEGQNILVDTGFPAKYAVDAEMATQEDGLESFGRVVSLTAENLPAGQLAKIGLQPSDIDTLIMTHTDIDHVGGIGDFPQSKILIHKDERASVAPRYWGNYSPIAWPENEYQLINSDTELCPGLILLSTPGHAPGHLSLRVHLAEHGPILLACDAISRPAELVDGFSGAWDKELAEWSALRLMEIARRDEAWVVYGHDPAQWDRLKKIPEFYA